MISLLIVLSLLILSFGLLLKFKLRGIAASVGLIGSDTDSAGIMYWLTSYYSKYKMPIRLLIVFATLVSMYRLFKNNLMRKNNKDFFVYYFWPLIALSCIILGSSLFRGQGIIIGLSELIWLGVPFFFLWVTGALRYKIDNLFVFFVLIQGIIAMLVILGGSTTADINGASYASKIGGEGWVVDPRDMINAPIAFLNFSKHDLSVIKFGHFHNPNSLGVYSVMLMVVSIYGMLKDKKKEYGHIRCAIWVIPMVIAIVLWMNSLTRGPVLLLMAWGAFWGLRRIQSKKILIILGLFGAVGLAVLIMNLEKISILRYLIVQSEDTSVVSRLGGYQFAFNAIINNPLIGQAASPYDAVPHILALKIAAYYGIPASILITIPFVHIGMFIFKKIKKEYSNILNLDFNYGVSIYCVLVGAILTNGVVVYVLFWIAFAEVLTRVGFLDQLNRQDFVNKL